MEGDKQEWHPSKGDMYKSLFDFLKHLTTLSAGSILLIATFLEKLFKQPKAPIYVTVSVGAFLGCLVTSMVAYLVFIVNFPRPGNFIPDAADGHVMAYSLVIAGVSFVAGIVFVGLFFLSNWSGI